MKDLVKAQQPKTIAEFITVYFKTFDGYRQKFLDIQSFYPSKNFSNRNNNEEKNHKNLNNKNYHTITK